MYHFLDPHDRHTDLLINPAQPYALLDTADIAIAAITGGGHLVYCNRVFLQDHVCDRRYAFTTSIRESLPEVWQRFKGLSRSGDEPFQVINLRSDRGGKPLGHLLIFFKKKIPETSEADLRTLISMPDHPDFVNAYSGLYVANAMADTVKVNPSYEAISFLSEHDLVGRNLAELVEKGFFSQSVTLSVLHGLKNGKSFPNTLLQTLLCGKNVVVSGKPVFSAEGNLEYILTYVQDLVVVETIARKCLEQQRRLTGSESTLDAVSNSLARIGKDPTDAELPEFAELPLVARDPLTIATFRQAVKAAGFEAPVLLTGETGVGKDMIAKYIHLLQARDKTIPFISVNCSAIPGDLLESELFGYEEGAFSGACKGGKAGLFAAAHGGVLFLNEISEMPLGLQAKLLTALDEGSIRPLGSNTTRKISVRILCATNRDLPACIEKGTFRRDLFYRIKVLSIPISPLRHRPKDILPLVRHFMTRLSSIYGLTRFVSPEVQQILLSYPWPGNVRELRNVVEQLMISSSTSQISLGDLPNELLGASSAPPRQQVGRLSDGLTLKMAVQRFEKELIEEALCRYGKTADAAQALDIDPTTLIRKLRRTN